MGILYAGFKAVILIEDNPILLTVAIVSIFMSLYSYSSFVLCVFLGQIVGSAFETIKRAIRKEKYLLFTLGPATGRERIMEWRRNYELACASAYEWDRSFGTILLIEICCIFIAFIVNSYYVAHSIKMDWNFSYYAFTIISLIRNSVALFVICLVSENIKSQV